MASDPISITIDDSEVQKGIASRLKRLKNPQPALKEIGLYMVRSITRNFKSQGRPDKWKPSSRARAQGGETLSDTGNLRGSIAYDIGARDVRIGTNVPYGPAHQFGATITAKNAKYLAYSIPGVGFRRSKSVTLPARQFLMFQEKDYQAITDILQSHIEKEAN